MLLLALIAHLLPVRARQPADGIAQVNPLLGHVSLTIIALVYVLLSVWNG